MRRSASPKHWTKAGSAMDISIVAVLYPGGNGIVAQPALVRSGRVSNNSLSSGFVISGRSLSSSIASSISTWFDRSTWFDSSPYTHPIRDASVSLVSPASYRFQSRGRRRVHPLDQLSNSARASKTRWNSPSLFPRNLCLPDLCQGKAVRKSQEKTSASSQLLPVIAGGAAVPRK